MTFFISPTFYYAYSALLLLTFGFLFLKIFRRYTEAKNISNAVVNKLVETGNKNQDASVRATEFNNWLTQNTSNSYIQNCIKPAWDYYYANFKRSQKKQVDITPDVYDFFLEDQFVHKYGKRKLVESIPGMFLSAGIFGTFLSIAVGVSILNINSDAATLKDGIGLLLGGMQGKFISSLVGIALSVSWQILDKAKNYPKLTESFLKLRQQLDETFPTSDESSVLYQLLKNEESRYHDYRKLISEEIIPEISKSIVETLQKTIVPALETASYNMVDMQRKGVSDMVNHFIDALYRMSGDHMKDLGEALQKSIEWQERVHKEVESLVQSIQQSAEIQVEISETNSTITEMNLQYADRFEQAVHQLTDNTEKMNTYQSEVSNVLDKLIIERDLFHDFYDKHMFNLQTDIDIIQNLTKQQVEYQDNLEENLKLMQSLSNSQMVLSRSLMDQAEHSESMTKELNKTVYMMQNHGSMFTKLQSQASDQFETIASERVKFNELYQEMLINIADKAGMIDDRVTSLHDIWITTTQSLSTSMNKFTADMNQGLTQAFNQIDTELAKSVNYLTESTSAIQYGFADLPNLMNELKTSLNEHNKEKVIG
jgi:hypothetical protein